MNKGPFVLVILDGWGISPKRRGNAIAAARTPTMDRLMTEWPHTQLYAHGEWVGLLPGQMGNSNVGHLNLGAGRIVYQDLVRVFRAIEDGSFFDNPALVEAVERGKSGALHLMGLVSDGGVHSHQEHLYALLDLARRRGVRRVFVHAFLDGRDVPPTSGVGYIRQLQERLKAVGVGRIATICGRYYAMDRDGRWDRTERAYRAMVQGEGWVGDDPVAAVQEAYRRGDTDEFVPPIVLRGEGRDHDGRMRDGDSVIFFNFRADRARQITRALADDGFAHFPRPERPRLFFTTFTQYDEDIRVPHAFAPQKVTNTLGEVIARHGWRQLRIAETEKYAHVTYFLNGGREEPYPGEERILIPSPRVATYDLKPEMSAFEVTEEAVARIASGQYQLVVVNYANPDMVGHTGVFEAAVRAIQAVDQCLGRLMKCVDECGGTAVVVGDHGNAEQMIDDDGGPHTAHTANPVPFIVVHPLARERGLRSGGLGHVAPTVLHLLGIERPAEMTCGSLLEHA